jgi:coenzyme F420-reducing hydrogenase delta subunit/ferredoxin
MSETNQTGTAGGAGGFEPRIIAFVCKWCTYAGADLAGTSRQTYPSNVRTIMLPCTGRIDVSFILRAFIDGADGVIVSGCHPGDCHYTAGNYRARRRWILLRDLLDTIGFDLNRLELAWISAAEGVKWVKTIQTFTEKIMAMGPFDALRRLTADDASALGSASGPVFQFEPAQPADPRLMAAVGEAIGSGKIKAAIGWTSNATLARPRPSWILSALAANELVAPCRSGNLARLLKNPKLKTALPLGIVARRSEVLALNVLAQEAQIDPAKLVLFTVGDDGKFAEIIELSAAPEVLARELPADRPAGFSEAAWKALDAWMARPAAERWAKWQEASARCIKCYACRGSCPLCGCEQCFTDRNQPQWFPTAADGRGNFPWHVMRAFHLAGRCIGCGSCTNACPVGIPLDILNTAMARSAWQHFEHRAGVRPSDPPLQSDYLPTDKEDFIL